MNLSQRILSALLTLVTSNTAFENSHKFCDLPSANDANFTFNEGSIFFLETSSKGGLSLRQACSVESAAKAHPNRHIYVFFTQPVLCASVSDKPHIALSKYKNIELYSLDIAKFSKGTPLEVVLKSRALKNSPYIVHHTADILRYLVLYKFSGYYSDLDVIMIRPLDTLPQAKNWASREDDYALAAGLMSISKDDVGRRVVGEIVRHLGNSYMPYNFSYNSIGVLKWALERICNTAELKKMTTATCHGFHVYETVYFYMLPPRLSELYFLPSSLKPDLKNIPNVYAFHVWNYVSRKFSIHPDSLYARLMKKYCPAVNSLTKDEASYKVTVVQRTKTNVHSDTISNTEKRIAKRTGSNNRTTNINTKKTSNDEKDTETENTTATILKDAISEFLSKEGYFRHRRRPKKQIMSRFRFMNIFRSYLLS